MDAEVFKGLVLMFRAPKEGDCDLFEKELTRHMLIPHSIPVLDFRFTNTDDLADCLVRQTEFSAIIFTSPRSVEATKKALQLLDGCEEKNQVKLSDFRCYVVGKGTQNTAREAGFLPLGANTGNAEKLAQTIIEDMEKEQRRDRRPMLYPCGNMRRDTLSTSLTQAGIQLKEITVYETVRNSNVTNLVEEMLQNKGVPEYIVYFSPSGVQYTAELFTSGLLPLSKIKVVAIGSTTEQELHGNDIRVHCTAKSPDTEGLLAAICDVS